MDDTHPWSSCAARPEPEKAGRPVTLPDVCGRHVVFAATSGSTKTSGERFADRPASETQYVLADIVPSHVFRDLGPGILR
jgi:hypothetical protein